MANMSWTHSMPVSAQVALMGLTYESMLTKPDGRTVLRHLVTAVVDSQLEKGTDLNVVTDTLQKCCGTLTNPKEVIMYKVRLAPTPFERLLMRR